MRRGARQLALLLVGMGLALPAPAQEAARAVRVEPTAATHEYTGYIVESDAVEYLVPLQRGQWLKVVLESSNVSNCFDIFAPGATKPLYQGGISGNHHEFEATAAGDYRIRVYLLRLAARDGQDARFSLRLTFPAP